MVTEKSSRKNKKLSVSITGQILRRLADLKPEVTAPAHGSTYLGVGESAIYDLAQAIKDVLE